VQPLPSILWNPNVCYHLHKGPHFSLSWARTVLSIPLHRLSARYILKLSTHLHLGLPSGHFPSGFPTNNIYSIRFHPHLLRASPLSFSLTWSF
jgi:hypothetical protein